MKEDRAPRLVEFDVTTIAPDESSPSTDRLVAGMPRNRTWNLEDDGAGLFAGIWESSTGEWRVDYVEWEFCHIVAGVSVLTEDGGEPNLFRAGDSFVIRPGFKGTWRVIETTVKHYVVRTAVD